MRFHDGIWRKKILRLHLAKPESTFLAWLDCRELGLPQSSSRNASRHFRKEAFLASFRVKVLTVWVEVASDSFFLERASNRNDLAVIVTSGVSH